jgi:hypothetical protein
VVEDFGTSPGATVAAAEALPAPADELGAGQEIVPEAAALLELELDGVPEEPLHAVARMATPMPSAASFAARGAAW